MQSKALIHQTHISSIILCGPFAYKLRRPVKHGFVDFSKASIRREDCTKEVKLNQRTAPDLYIGVVAIRGSIETPTINGSGNTLEWAVQMHRFPQDALLSQQISEQRLTPAITAKLAHRLAAFHTSLPGLYADKAENSKPTRERLMASLNEIRIAKPALLVQLKEISAFAKGHANRHRNLCQQRRLRGMHRDCHGDLHLGNLLNWHGEPIAFDALEFSTDLRQIDIVNDIAFTFMDLLAHARADLAWTLMDAWCEQTADYQGLALLRFYTLYRAIVRAKVAIIANDKVAFDRYWQLSRRLIQPANPPKLVLVSGLSGSGKSNIARDLVSFLSGIRLRTDIIRQILIAAEVIDRREVYSPEAIDRTYQEVVTIAQQLLADHLTVIVDATFLKQHQVDLFTALSRQCHIEPIVIHCQAPRRVLESRIKKRAATKQDASEATIDVLSKQIEQLALHPIRWPTPPININTDHRRDTVRQHLLAQLSKT